MARQLRLLGLKNSSYGVLLFQETIGFTPHSRKISSLINIQPSEQDWNRHRTELERLYVGKNKSVQYIKRYMEEKYQFRASKYQFDKHFNKQWNCSKYGSSTAWKAILPHVRKLEQEGKGAAVFIDMKRKSSQEVRNAMARYKGFLSNPDSAGLPVLPKNVLVQPDVQPIKVLIPQQLPFYVMESQMPKICKYLINRAGPANRDIPNSYYTNLPQPLAGHHSTVATAASNEVQRNSPLERILSIAVPPEQCEPVTFNLPMMSLESRLFASPFHRALVYSMTNNLVGFDAIPHQEILRFLKQETTNNFFRALSKEPDLYSVQALTQSTFWLALNAGDAEAITFILGHSSGLDVNGDIPGRRGIVARDITLTKPIEVASKLGHIEVVSALIDAGAKVDGTNAFSMLLRHGSKRIPEARIPWVLGQLADSSSSLSPNQLIDIIHQNHSRTVQELIMKHIGNNYQDWTENGVLLAIFEKQPSYTCHEALEALRECGVDLDAPLKSVGTRYRSIVDVLAHRLDAETLCEILDCFPQLHLTEEAVIQIISNSGYTSLVRYALIHGPNVYGNSKYRYDLISRATAEDLIAYAGNDETSTVHSASQRISRGIVVLEFLASYSTDDIQNLKESLILAALVGNVERIRELLTNALTVHGTRCSELLERYTWLIYRTIQAGHPEAALCIVEAGVKIDRCDKCLKKALKIKHTSLVRALLDATDVSGQYPRPDGDHYEQYHGSFIPFAIENGEYELIQVLLEYGMSPDIGCPSALEVAFSCNRLDVAKLLLDFGANINRKSFPDPDSDSDEGQTALQAAAETSDPTIVQFALDYGADPHDPKAIYIAAEEGLCLFNLIIDEHRRCYNKGRRDWGVYVLARCINTGDLEMFKEMIFTHMADVHSIHWDATKESSFGYAVRKSERTGLEFLEVLLGNKDKLRCFPNTKVSIDMTRTAFLVAVDTGYLPTINLFLKHGADPGFLPKGVKRARTPLQLAAENGSMEVIRLLLDHGASVNDPIAYDGGATALQLAALQGYIRIVQLLMERGAEVDAPPAKLYGNTALEGAARHGRLDTVAFLLDAGAADKGRDKHQLNRAIRYAKDEGHVAVEQLLQDFVETGELQTRMGFFPDFVDLDAC